MINLNFLNLSLAILGILIAWVIWTFVLVMIDRRYWIKGREDDN